MYQLNYLFFDRNKLREALYSKLAPLFPGHLTLYNTIERHITLGFNVNNIGEELKAGNYCEDCIEPCCCTKSDPVGLVPPDIERLDALGYKDYSKLYTDYLGQTALSFKDVLPCGFLKDNRCTIYKDRPYVCRRYPFNEDGTTGKLFFYAANNCNIAFNVLKKQIIDELTIK